MAKEKTREHLRVLAKELRWVANHIDEIAADMGDENEVTDEEVVADNQLKLFEDK